MWIVLEGPDGSGKSSLQRALLDRFGDDAVGIREPSDGPLGTRIRADLQAGVPFDTPEMAERFAEDRRIQYDDVVRPLLRQGTIVVQDRSWLSTLVYQATTPGTVGQILSTYLARDPDGLLRPAPSLVVFCDASMDTLSARLEKKWTITGRLAIEERKVLIQHATRYRALRPFVQAFLGWPVLYIETSIHNVDEGANLVQREVDDVRIRKKAS